MIFIDTGAFLARYLERDEYHGAALRGFTRIQRERLPAATSAHVLDEAITLLGRWAGHSFAAERARAVLASRAIRVLRPVEDDEVRALAVFEKYADQGISFTDAVSIALMRTRRMQEAFTFDRHFALAGFTLWPQTQGREAGRDATACR